MGSALADSVPEEVAEHTAMFEELFGSDAPLIAHLEREVSQRAGGNPDLVTDKTNDTFREYVADADPDELESLFQDVDLADIDPERSSIRSTYAEDVVAAAQQVAERALEERGIDLDLDVASVYDSRYTGGGFDWSTNTVRVGRPSNQLSFNPSLLGVMVHELAHAHQFQQKVEQGVERYNELVAQHDLPDGPEPVSDADERYLDYGVMMAANGDRITAIFERAMDADGDATAYGRHLKAAIETELEQAAIDADNRWEPFEEATIGPIFSADEEALPHLLYLDVTGELTEDRIDRYVDEVVSTYDEAKQIRQEMRELRRGDDVLFPGAGSAGAEGYRDAVAMLEEADVDVESPHPGDVFFHSQELEEGDTEAEYVRGTDAIVTYLDDERLYPSTLSHELIHYAQVHRALGDPDDAFHESLTTLRETVRTARDKLGAAFVDEELLSGPHLATNRDVNVASMLYEFTGDLEQAYADTVGSGGSVDDFLALVEAPDMRDDDRHRTVMEPIAERAHQVNKLPLDSYGEADAMFWSLYNACSNAHDTVERDHLFEKLYQHWDDDTPSLAESLLHYDTQDAAYSQAILDGIESRIETYDQLKENGLDDNTAAGAIINRGLDRFERLGESIAAYEG